MWDLYAVFMTEDGERPAHCDLAMAKAIVRADSPTQALVQAGVPFDQFGFAYVWRQDYNELKNVYDKLQQVFGE